jgi:hypothetical protein
LVLLRHDTPDGAHHYDLMLERRAGDGRLLTIRLDRRIEVGVAGRAEGEMLGEHRRAYLEYEGAVSGGRGCVRREWTSEGELVEESSACVRIGVKSGGVIVMRREGEGWSVEVGAGEAEGSGVESGGKGGGMMGGGGRG